LRSPLHGILGSIEFLHDTSIDAHQSALIGQVETCGKTLLDTINHVLDYSKINDFGATKELGASGKGAQSRSSSGKDVSLNLVADFDLGVLVEEVTEAIFAGRIFNRQRRAERVRSTGVRKVLPRTQSQPLAEPALGENISNSDTEVVPQNVAVILNISKEDNWNVRAQPGALRRLIMNLLVSVVISSTTFDSITDKFPG
jgi:signal transduction histidine kinase